MAAEAVKLVVLLSRIRRQFHLATVAVEVVGVVGIPAELQHRLVDDHVAFLAKISARSRRKEREKRVMNFSCFLSMCLFRCAVASL